MNCFRTCDREPGCSLPKTLPSNHSRTPNDDDDGDDGVDDGEADDDGDDDVDNALLTVVAGVATESPAPRAA